MCGVHATAWATWRCTYAWRAIPCTYCLLQPPQGIWGTQVKPYPFCLVFRVNQPTYYIYIFLSFDSHLNFNSNPPIKPPCKRMHGGYDGVHDHPPKPGSYILHIDEVGFEWEFVRECEFRTGLDISWGSESMNIFMHLG